MSERLSLLDKDKSRVDFDGASVTDVSYLHTLAHGLSQLAHPGREKKVVATEENIDAGSESEKKKSIQPTLPSRARVAPTLAC